MPLTSEILQAAQELGAALRATSSVQSYLQSDAEFQGDEQTTRLEAEIRQCHEVLSKKERAGTVLSPAEIGQYHNRKDQLRRNRLYIKRDSDLREVQFVLAQTAETISSVLSVNYSGLVNHEGKESGSCGSQI
jgi:cell fate (sporulation/competence/biofilm development) regulator YlbF (YheA/YmcA/DUF963 family)